MEKVIRADELEAMKYEHRGLDPETEGRKRSPRVENGA
jgi:hypothetical protein